MALAHRVGSATELAYRRGDLLAKRRALAEAWAKFLGGARPAEDTGRVVGRVVALRG
jgi:hypothetical protein